MSAENKITGTEGKRTSGSSPSSQMESLEEACMVHGIPVEKLVSVINEYLAQKQQ